MPGCIPQKVMCHVLECVFVCVCVQLCLILCNPMDYKACQVPVSMGFLRQCWNGLPFPPPGDLPNPGIKPISLASSALAGRFFTTEPSGIPLECGLCIYLLCFH